MTKSINFQTSKRYEILEPNTSAVSGGWFGRCGNLKNISETLDKSQEEYCNYLNKTVKFNKPKVEKKDDGKKEKKIAPKKQPLLLFNDKT